MFLMQNIHDNCIISRPVKLLRFFSATVSEDRVKQCYRILGIPQNANQDTVRKAFIQLAKKYHPDSGNDEANIERFCQIEDAFRILTKKNTGSTEEVDTIQYDIRHTAPQHRHYLSYDGVGHGSPAQRQKQHAQARAQKAADNVLQHRMSKAVASENTLVQKEKKHDIKTQYGFDRLVEDLIQEAMSKGEFDNLSGKGKPLKGQNFNPFVDFTTHKINEVLINNGFTPEWIVLNKDINHEIIWLKQELTKERAKLGPLPLTAEEEMRWKRTCEEFEKYAKKINSKILSFNLVVPILTKQMFLLKLNDITKEILLNGEFKHRENNLVQSNNNLNQKESEALMTDMFVQIFTEFVCMLSLIYKFLKRMVKQK